MPPDVESQTFLSQFARFVRRYNAELEAVISAAFKTDSLTDGELQLCMKAALWGRARRRLAVLYTYFEAGVAPPRAAEDLLVRVSPQTG